MTKWVECGDNDATIIPAPLHQRIAIVCPFADKLGGRPTEVHSRICPVIAWRIALSLDGADPTPILPSTGILARGDEWGIIAVDGRIHMGNGTLYASMDDVISEALRIAQEKWDKENPDPPVLERRKPASKQPRGWRQITWARNPKGSLKKKAVQKKARRAR